MGDFFGIGEGISGTLGFASSMYGHNVNKHESQKNRQEARRQFDEQMNESVQRRVQDALKAGINPLAALGYSGGASPTIHAGGTSGAGEIIANAGFHLSKALRAFFEDKSVDDAELDTQSRELSVESQRIQNQILQKQLDNMSTPGVDEEKPSMMGQDLLLKPVYDLQGRPRLVVNQNVMESDADNPGYMSSIMATIAAGIKDGQIDPVSGRIKSDQMRMMLDDMYFNMTGHRIMNLEELYISPSEAAAAAAYMARGVSVI